MNQEVKTINGYKVKDEKAIRTYDTVALMKSDTKLKKGQHVKTRGYYSINDGGSAEYYITDTSSNSDYQENLENGIYATLIKNKKDVINVLQCGAISDGETDNSSLFNNIIDYCNENYNAIYIPKGRYLISEDLHDINDGTSIYGDISGNGMNEINSTIVDGRTSSNYLFNCVKTENSKKGGTIKYLNFISQTNQFINKCIHITDSINYYGNISNCCFMDYGVAINIDNSHGFVLDKCMFLRCGSSQENSSDYAIIVDNTTDCSINNCCIDHTRYQLYATLNCMLYVNNTHFELSTRNLVKGSNPISCQVGNYGFVGFSNCSFINLSYLAWIDIANYLNGNDVPFMIGGSYVEINNCMFSCGIGSGGSRTDIDKRAKYASIYYGSIANCKIKSPSYMINSFTLSQSSMTNNHFQVDLVPEDYDNIAKNNYIISTSNVNCSNNYLQFVIPQTVEESNFPTIYPTLYSTYNDMSSIETNRGNILFNKKLPNSKLHNVNTLRIQSNSNLVGLYKLKCYSIGETKLIYEGYIMFNNDKSFTLVDTVYKSFGSGNNIVLFSDDDSNDKYIQINMPTYLTNILYLELENLSGHANVITYYDTKITSSLTYTNSLTIDSE